MLKWICLSWMVFAMVAGAQPTINTDGIVNAASSAPVGLPNSSIAQGSIFSIYGANMGPVGGVLVSAWPLQKSLGGVTVQIQDASGAQLLAIPLYVGAGQINALLPSATAVGTANATVTYAGATSAPAPFTVAQSSFGSFSLTAAGSGPGAVQNYVQNPPWPTNTIISAAQPGQAVILYGTGLGPVTGDETIPPVPVDLRSGLSPMTLWVGGQQAPIAYAGRSTSAGEDQINFNVPINITGCFVPVALQIGNVVSNTVSISISPSGGACQDSSFPNLNPVVMEANGLREGTLLLQQYTLHQPPSVNGVRQSIAAEFLSYAWPYPVVLSGSVDVHGACTVSAGAGISLPFTLLDAGSPVTMATPGGNNMTLIQPIATPVGYYSGGSQGALTAGVYTVKDASGGKDVGSFSASLTLPAPIVLTNLNDVANGIILANGFTITWTGGSGDVYISGSSSAVVNRKAVTGSFTCLANASDGSFTVPLYVLAALPPSVAGGGGGLQVDNYAVTTTFSASGLDLGLFQADFTTNESLSFY
ncbi:MAG: hypothetical protein ACLQGV_20120 [Bryobacteraceae bacterium]